MMQKTLSLLVLCSALAGLLVGCGTTPAPTKAPPTQTPWIIVVTATPGPEEAAEVLPTQTPWIVVATPTRTSRPASIATATPATTERATPGSGTAVAPIGTPELTQVPATATNTPEPEALIYQAPVLVDPPNEVLYGWRSTILLKWSAVGELAPDEYYRLELERPPQTKVQKWYGDYVFTKDTSFLVRGAFLAPFHLPAEQGQARVYWSVRVVRQTGVDESGKPIGVDISQPSEKRTFRLEPKPSDA
jgi:hypothetical protein